MANRANPKKDNKNAREAAGIVMIIISAFFLVCLIYPDILSVIGNGIYKVLTGLLGIFAYAFFLITLLYGVFLLRGLKLAVTKKRLTYIILLSVSLLFVLQLITTHALLSEPIGTYLSKVYGFKDNMSIGGVFFGSFAYGARAALAVAGAYIFFCLLVCLFGVLFALDIIGGRRPLKENKRNYKKQPVNFAKGNAVAAPVKPIINNGLFIENIIPKEKRIVSDGGSFSEIGRGKSEKEKTRNLGDFFESVKAQESEEESQQKQNAKKILFGDSERMLNESTLRFINRVNSEREFSREEIPIPKTLTSPPSVWAYEEKEEENPLKKSQKLVPEVIFPPEKENHVKIIDGEIINAEEFSHNLKSTERGKFTPLPKSPATFSPLPKEDYYYDEKYKFDDKTEAAKKFLFTSALASGLPIKKESKPHIYEREEEEYGREEEEESLESDDTLEEIINCEEFSAPKGSIGGIYSTVFPSNTIEYPDDNVYEPTQDGGFKVYKKNQPEYSFSFDEEEDQEMQAEEVPEEDPFTQEAFDYTNVTQNEIEALKTDDEYRSETNVRQAKRDSYEPYGFEKSVSKPKTGTAEKNESVAKMYELKELYNAQSKQPPPYSAQEVEKAGQKEQSVKQSETYSDFKSEPLAEFKKPEEEHPYIQHKEPENEQQDYTGYYIKEKMETPKPADSGFLGRVAKLEKKIDPKNQINIDNLINSDSEGETSKEQTAAALKQQQRKKNRRYIAPHGALLTGESTNPDDFGGDYESNATILEETLKNLKLPAKVINITRGPAVTRYELEMPSGATVKRIEGFSQDIAYALASSSGIRIEAPIPGKRAVGVEVPNQSIGIVALKDLINSNDFGKAPSHLTLCIGKDIGDRIVLCNLEKMPHLLIAGSTGSGKSACLHSLIVSMLYKASPADLRLILIDPKRVEFLCYENLPHLLINQIINEKEHAVNALKWAREEMEARFKLMAKQGARNLAEYNMCRAVREGEEEKLPSIVLIVDELSDLMMGESKKEIEEHILSIAQKARAAGMHLILATQRPSVNVITGTIKVNFPSRIAFAVSNGIDSKTILDRSGAEMLLGRGDLLYAPIDAPDPSRIQGAYVIKDEVEAVVDFIVENNEAEFDEEAEKFIMRTKEVESENRSAESGVDDEFDALLEDVARKVIETNQASAAMLQRRFKLGYARAARILDQMEQLNFIGPLDYNKTKPREIFITKEMFKEFFGKDY